jgi:hypothetical protein
MSVPEDSRLRTHFANLREEDRSAAPPFGPTATAGAAVSHRGLSLRIALAAVPVLAIGVVLTVRTHRSTDSQPHELTAWSSPTAFLLETPGTQLLNQTPRLGEPLIHDLPAVQGGPK